MNSMFGQANYQYELFVSYTSTDRIWVESYLLPALNLPSERIITTQDFRPGALLVNEFERAVTNSRYTVLVLSPHYLNDKWSTLSEHLVSYSTVAEQSDHIIPLLLKPCDLPLRIDYRVRLDCTSETNWEREFARLCDLLAKSELNEHKDSTKETTLPDSINQELPLLVDVLVKITNPFVKRMETELRTNKIYWKISSFEEPILSSSFTSEYFSRQAVKVLLLQNKLKKNDDFGSINFIRSMSASLDEIFEQSHQVKQLTDVAPDFERSISIKKAISKVTDDATKLKVALNQARFEAISSRISVQVWRHLADLLGFLSISLGQLHQLFQELDSEARNTSSFAD